MSSYWLKCRKNTESINPRVSKPNNGKIWYYQNVQYMVAKNQDLLKKQEASVILSNLSGKLLMFAKLLLKSFVYKLIEIFCFPNEKTAII